MPPRTETGNDSYSPDAINKQNRWSTITPDVQEVAGKPPIDFSEFARDHADKFWQRIKFSRGKYQQNKDSEEEQVNAAL